MVKNEKGGSKHKKFARKNVKGNSGFDERVRKSEHVDEIYASVSRILGNGRVEILCNDGQSRHCVIRNKFRGKNRRGNGVEQGSVILAGRRSWETPNPDKIETCDLLCVYNSSQINKLKTDPSVDVELLQRTSKNAFDKDVGIQFFDRMMPEELESEDETNIENNEQDVENEEVILLMNTQRADMINVDDI